MIGIRVRTVVLAVLLSAALLFISQATAEGPNAVLNLAGCTANTLAANDDSYTGVNVPIGFTANFFGTPYTQLSVNNNGNVTFDAGLYKYTPFDFTVTGNVIIAPFLADVDTRGTGSGVVTYGQTTYGGSPAFCVNWVNVGYFYEHTDKLNSFQLLLVKQGNAGNFDIIFNYDKVLWETGDVSGGSGGLGGTSAALGYSNGDGDHFYVRDGSYTNGALLDSNATTGLTHGSLGTTQLGRYIFPVRNVPPTGSTLTGTVNDPDGFAVAQAPVEICRSGGTCTTRFSNDLGVYRAINLVAGSYTVTAHTPNDRDLTSGSAGPVAVSGVAGASFTRDVTLGPAPGAPPAGTTITSISTTSDGIPVIYWTDPITVTTGACTGGTGTFSISVAGHVVRAGAMTETPSGSGHYVGTAAALYPNHGDGAVHISIDCPGSTPNQTVVFGIYVDPSGKVVDAGTNLPISGATVTLLRSDSAAGPFIPVANGSAVMSAANRDNPSTTPADGGFGWDVIAGFYKVQASSSTCGTAESAVLNIPPPAVNLVIKLPCPHNLTVTKEGSGTGTVTSSPAGIDCGSTCVQAFNAGTSMTLTATPAANSRFGGWSGSGCSGSANCSFTMRGDTTVTATFINIPPLNTKIIKAKVNSKKRTATFKFKGSGGLGKITFQCKMDKKKYASCKSGKTFKKLKPGKHILRVRAKDSRGKVDTTPASKKFSIKR